MYMLLLMYCAIAPLIPCWNLCWTCKIWRQIAKVAPALHCCHPGHRPPLQTCSCAVRALTDRCADVALPVSAYHLLALTAVYNTSRHRFHHIWHILLTSEYIEFELYCHKLFVMTNMPQLWREIYQSAGIVLWTKIYSKPWLNTIFKKIHAI